MSHGESIEDFVERLCTRSFLADFTFRSPEYRKQCGLTKEASDFLVVFDDTLLAIQVKSRKFDVDCSSFGPVEFKRLTSRLDKAVLQFRALMEAMKSSSFTAFENGRGAKIEFDKKKVKNIILLVVFAPLFTQGNRTRLLIGHDCYLDEEMDIPIHIFTLDEFTVLVKLLDTLPDFLNFLNARWVLHRERLVHGKVDPLDEWAFVTFERERFRDALEKRSPIDVAGLNAKHKGSLRRLEHDEKPSYMIDALIELLYRGIGMRIPIFRGLAGKKMIVEPNSFGGYQMVIPYLAKLDRYERRQLGEAFVEKVFDSRKPEKGGIAFRGLKFETHDEAYLVLAAKFNQRGRQAALYGIGWCLGQELKVKKVIGIAGGSRGSVLGLSEAMVLDIEKETPDQRLLRESQTLFSQSRLFDHRDSA